MAPSSFEQLTTEADPDNGKNLHPVKFIVTETGKYSSQKINIPRYRTEVQSITLETSEVGHFVTLNGTVCFILGTDVEYMKRLKGFALKCECKQGWHGRDCGQPEVVWRAYIASQQKISPKKRKKPRRLIHAFSIINLEITLVEIKIRELSDVVDLFIVCESNYTETGEEKSLYFQNKLRKGFLHDIQHKILYVPVEIYKNNEAHLQTMKKELWLRGKRAINNLRDDDMLVLMDTHEIPNTKALLFFKLYDSWPQPVGFRLRWSVYGFFWQHPKKTITAPGAWSVQLMEDDYHSDLSKIPTGDEALSFGLVIGDLNHYGGWYCSWCFHPQDVVLALQGSKGNPVKWNKVDKKIDANSIEEHIGSGLWLDSTTMLVRKYQYGDPYYAPQYVLNNSWKYDFLLTNFYARNDYN
ncbi:Uncharacterized protein GBIM_10634 [Gryllus bimaculatus]|nr:Uncharacterized protein GBIM_10634 [Gryllus bimaculatus]